MKARSVLIRGSITIVISIRFPPLATISVDLGPDNCPLDEVEKMKEVCYPGECPLKHMYGVVMNSQ